MLRLLLLISKACAGNPIMVAMSVIVGVGAMTRIQDSLYEAFWWFIPCLAIIGADLSSAYNAKKAKDGNWRWTTAARRTINKIICYICWIIFCVSLNHQYNTQLATLAGMAFVFIVEGSSFVNNRLDALGYHLSLKGILAVFGRRKGIEHLEDIVDKNDKEEEK